MLWDTHMHTHHSGDSDALMPDMIQAAVRQNLDGICFTDHFDYDYPDDPNLFLLDFDSYIKEVRSFQDTCRDRLSIRLGDRKSTRLNSSHNRESRMPSSA